MQNTDERILLPKKLTAENGAKALLNGEFHEEVEMSDAEGVDYVQKFTVSWDTIKEIYKKVVEFYHQPPQITENWKPTEYELSQMGFHSTSCKWVNTHDLEGDIFISHDFGRFNIIYQEGKWYFFDDGYHSTREINVTCKEDIDTVKRLFHNPTDHVKA